jgi:signal transduction histidine kinase
MSQHDEEHPDIIPFPGGGDVDLATVLDAWQTATDRLSGTHELLRGEIARLTRELEIKNRELARKNRLADLGQMASHVAHEVRNGLMPLTLYLGLLKRRLVGDPAALELVGKLDAGFGALQSTVNDLLHFTSDREPQPRVFALAALCHEVHDSLALQFSAQEIACDIDCPQRLLVSADRDMLRRAILNLLLNAVDVLPQGGQICLSGCQTATGIEIEVADSGPGIAGQVAPRLFEPFFTTKSEGTGLGLAIVQRIVEVHGGSVSAMNCPEGGAAFTIRLPRKAMEAAA